MKKKSNVLITVAVALLALAIILWVTGRDADSASTSAETNDVTVVIFANDEEMANDTLEVADDMTLMQIMEEHYDMSVSEEGFVQAIEGVEQNVEDNEYWVFEANEEMVTDPADEFIPADGDTILWELMAF